LADLQPGEIKPKVARPIMIPSSLDSEYVIVEFPQKDYDRISIEQDFRDSTLRDVKLKTNIGLAPGLESEIKENPKIKLEAEQCQQYLLYSDNFITYAFGLKEAAEDVITRDIDLYGSE